MKMKTVLSQRKAQKKKRKRKIGTMNYKKKRKWRMKALTTLLWRIRNRTSKKKYLRKNL